jgi:hypothetical protein
MGKWHRENARGIIEYHFYQTEDLIPGTTLINIHNQELTIMGDQRIDEIDLGRHSHRIISDGIT